MALSNALFAGLSGLDVNQVKLNVVGNNIANVNTVAFKATRVLIKPQFYVTDSGGSQPSGEMGGTNPSQRGLGAVVASLDRNYGPGSIESTGTPTDLAIDGDGYFVVKGEEQRYTRDGSFRLNSANQLVTSGGDFVQGYAVDQDFEIIAGQLTSVTLPVGAMTTAEATSKASFEGNLNASGPVASGASILSSQLLTRVGGGAAPVGGTLLTEVAATSSPATALFEVGETYTLAGTKGGSDVPAASFEVGAGSTLGDLTAFFEESLGINTLVPDDGDPTTPPAGVVVEADATDPNSARMVVAGNLGAGNALSLPAGSFRTTVGSKVPLAFAGGSNAAGNTDGAIGESVRVPFVAYDSLGTPIRVDVTAVRSGTSTTGNSWRFYAESADSTTGDRAVGTGTLTFDGNGNLIGSEGTTILIPRSGTGAITPLVMELDFSRLMSLSDTKSSLIMKNRDGSAIGGLTSYNIGADGKITGSFSNGVTRTLGQLAMATFSNAQGLLDCGGNMLMESPNSGSAIIGTPGRLGAGEIVAGALELSNVDLSEEFINLIIASTGFSAASRVISTSDRLIQELLNASR